MILDIRKVTAFFAVFALLAVITTESACAIGRNRRGRNQCCVTPSAPHSTVATQGYTTCQSTSLVNVHSCSHVTQHVGANGAVSAQYDPNIHSRYHVSLTSPGASAAMAALLDIQLGVCNGNNGNCAFTATGTVSDSDTGSKPTAVYMIIGRNCPDCAAGNSVCQNPTTKPWLIPSTSFTYNSTTHKASVLFSSVDNPDDLRIVSCNATTNVCFVICYQDGSCKTKNFGLQHPGSICQGNCPDCAYAQ